jgi:hypothetical protein
VIILSSALPEFIFEYPGYERWLFETYGEEFLLDLYDSLKYHAQFAGFEPRFEPILPELFFEGVVSSEVIARMVRDYLNDNYMESARENIMRALEHYCIDFLSYIGIPDHVFMSSSRDIDNLRQLEFNSQVLALKTARAFSEGDTAFLNGMFYSFTDDLFDFVHYVNYTRFHITRAIYEPDTMEFGFYININTALGDGFKNSFNDEWLLFLNPYVMGFSPVIDGQRSEGDIITMNNLWHRERYNGLVGFCYMYSTLIQFPEPEWRDELSGMLHALAYINSEFDSRRFTPDSFIEAASYVFGVEINYDTLRNSRLLYEEEDGSEWLALPGRGLNTTTATLVSARSTGDERNTIIINYFGDTGYLFLARQVMYELEYGEQGWRLLSVEITYEDPNVNVSFFHP